MEKWEVIHQMNHMENITEIIFEIQWLLFFKVYSQT